MEAKYFRCVLLFLCNRWTKEMAANIYNSRKDGTLCDWQFSLAEHIWNKWIEGCKNHGGALDCIAWFLTELDNDNLQKLIDYSINYYYESK